MQNIRAVDKYNQLLKQYWIRAKLPEQVRNFQRKMEIANPAERTRLIKRFQLAEEEMRNKFAWRMGWVTFEEIKMAHKGPLIDAKACFRCKGGCVIKCVECDGKGKLGYHQQLFDINH